MLSERGNPKEGFLFVSQTKEKGIAGIETRRINDAIQNLAENSLGTEKAKEFQTKMLSFYNSALLQAGIQGEIKDIMMGHLRQGARAHYGYDSATITENYEKALPVSVNKRLAITKRH